MNPDSPKPERQTPLRAVYKWPTRGIIELRLIMSLVVTFGCLIGGYWLGYSHRDAQCKAATSSRQVEELAGVINRATDTAQLKQQLDEQGSEQQAYAEQVQTMIRKEQRQREEFWRKQREQNQSCDAWLRAVVPCRMQPEAIGGDATTTVGGDAATNLSQ